MANIKKIIGEIDKFVEKFYNPDEYVEFPKLVKKDFEELKKRLR